MPSKYSGAFICEVMDRYQKGESIESIKMKQKSANRMERFIRQVRA